MSKEEGQGVPHVRAYATPAGSLRRLVLGTYGLALSTIVHGMAALCHLTHTYMRPDYYKRNLGSAIMCEITKQYNGECILFWVLCTI